MPRFRKLACLTGVFLAVSANATPPIYAPVKVGRPPANAFVGLSILPDGEIRHYNYQGVLHEGIEPHGPPLGQVYSYISSRDGGLTWTDHVPPESILGADVRSPVSGEYLRIFSDTSGTFILKSIGGPDGKWSRRKIDDRRFIMVKPPVFIRGGRRAVVCMHSLTGTVTFYTDDDGESWSISNLISAPPHEVNWRDRHPRWQNLGVEGSLVELLDGRLWMLLRTSQDYHYESYSADGGAS